MATPGSNINVLGQETRDIVAKYGEELITEIVRLLRSEDKVATGSLINSFRWEAVAAAKELNYHLISLDYFKYVDQGRRAGKQPPLREIMRWTSVKGIPQEAAFPIARNIGKFGIPATNILKRSIRNVSRNFEQELSDHLRERIVNIIDESARMDQSVG